MKKDLLDISNSLEDEVLFAKAITEIISVLHAASYGSEIIEFEFKELQNAFWLVREIAKFHSENLFEISTEVFNAFKETSAHSNSNAPV